MQEQQHSACPERLTGAMALRGGDPVWDGSALRSSERARIHFCANLMQAREESCPACETQHLSGMFDFTRASR